MIARSIPSSSDFRPVGTAILAGCRIRKKGPGALSGRQITEPRHKQNVRLRAEATTISLAADAAEDAKAGDGPWLPFRYTPRHIPRCAPQPSSALVSRTSSTPGAMASNLVGCRMKPAKPNTTARKGTGGVGDAGAMRVPSHPTDPPFALWLLEDAPSPGFVSRPSLDRGDHDMEEIALATPPPVVLVILSCPHRSPTPADRLARHHRRAVPQRGRADCRGAARGTAHHPVPDAAAPHRRTLTHAPRPARGCGRARGRAVSL